MKRYLLSAAALCFAMAMSAQSLFVGSYNIRYHNSDDDLNGNVWKTRCKVICDQIDFWTAIGAVVLLSVLGMLAGLAPALRAMHIKPVDAMRDE